MSRKILFVDDEENILRGFERTLRSTYQIETAVGPSLGLAALAERGPFAVVVSDLRMPGMDGIQFLSEARKRHPDTVRLMLSGNADFEAAVSAVNRGHVFQFLTKPCPPDQLRAALDAAIAQNRLIVAERELLEQTLHGSVGMMTEVLSVVNPIAFGRASRIRRYVRQMSTDLHLPNLWEFDVAAMLSQIGCIAVPPDILEKVYGGKTLTKTEAESFAGHPSVGHDLVAKIPRLEVISEIIRLQATPLHFHPANLGDVIAVGAQMLMIATCFDDAITKGATPASAVKLMRDRPSVYQATLVAAIERAEICTAELVRKALYLRELRPRMIVDQDIQVKNGLFIVAKGQIISDALIARLLNFASAFGIAEPVSMLVPVTKPANEDPMVDEKLLSKLPERVPGQAGRAL